MWQFACQNPFWFVVFTFFAFCAVTSTVASLAGIFNRKPVINIASLDVVGEVSSAKGISAS